MVMMVDADTPLWMKNQPIVDDFVRNSTKLFSGSDLEKIRNYSQIISEEATEYTDAYHGKEAGAKRYTFRFEGVVVKGFYIPGKRFFLEYIEITTPRYRLVDGIKIGSRESEVKAYFKSAGKTEGNTIHFWGESEKVVFTINDGVVSKIQLYGYTG